MKTISPLERPLLRFVVITDTHVNGEGSSPYPYPSGVLANSRAAAAFAKIRALKPDLVLHLGDMVHPLPGQLNFASAVANFRQIIGDLEVPIRWIPGNHDIGDKPSCWLPAPPVSKETHTIYTDALGPDRHCFEHNGIRFVMADATLINSGMDAEEEQWNWLDTNIPRNRRSFLFMHYPPYLTDTDEPEHYDNIANPGRSRLLAMLRDRPVEALFTGHVHNIFMNRFGNTDIHVLPATSFVRNDYSQLFPVPPIDEENGRNHVSRLGFMLVEVFEKAHTVHWVNTNGGTDPEIADQQMTVSMLHPRRRAAPVGVDLRQEWARPLPIIPDGCCDELSRKYVRNDYLAMRLHSLGLRHLRVPMQDLIDERAAARMSDFAAFGHTFTVYGVGVPTTEIGDRLAAVAPILSGVEVILPPEAFAETSAPLAAFSRAIGAPVMLSKLHASGRHGFPAEEVDEAFAAIPAGIAGLCFAIEPTAPLWLPLEAIAAAAHKYGKRALVHVRLAGASFAKDAGTPEENARRIAEATLAGWADRAVLDIVIDTFVDFDRGYFLRSGLLDPLCDLRPAGAVLQRLAELLADTPDGGSVRAEGSLRYFSIAGKHYALALNKLPTIKGSSTAIRLDTGTMIATHAEAAGMPILLS
ncbi:metallophosphoesterase [Mesorhizobium prunaredense]|nr:metallophosphoesterase [Mesorhizobium prunaredense]